MRVSLVEYGIFKYPKGLEQWRLYRIEYGGSNENCVYEGEIWLPSEMPPDEIENLINDFKGGEVNGKS